MINIRKGRRGREKIKEGFAKKGKKVGDCLGFVVSSGRRKYEGK